MGLDKERKAFEEAFKKKHSGVSFWLNTWCEEDQDYGHLTASWVWQMWQASASREGYKLVPIQNICVHHHWVESAVNDEVMQCVICGVFE